MAKSAQFRCPHCQTLLNKGPVNEVLGEVRSFFVFGPATLPCPRCGRAIDRLGIIDGKYDVKGPGLVTLAFLLAVAVFIIYCLSQC